MKPFISYAFLAAAAASGFAFGQTPVTARTTPVGYVTQELAANSFNLLGLTLHPSTIFNGRVTAVSSTSISSSAANFDSLLTAGKTYVLEVRNGNQAGIIQEIVSWSGGSLSTVQDLVALGVEVGNEISLRVAPSLEEAFGTVESVLTKGFSSAAADIIWVPDGSGSYVRYYLHSSNAWRDVTTNANAPNVPLVYADGVLIEKKAASSALVTTGEVKLVSTKSSVATGFNVVSTVYPVGVTLQNSGLETGLTAGFNSASADVVWVPTSSGEYERYYRHSSGNWRLVSTNSDVAGPVVLTSAVLIERKGAAANIILTPPNYNNPS